MFHARNLFFFAYSKLKKQNKKQRKRHRKNENDLTRQPRLEGRHLESLK